MPFTATETFDQYRVTQGVYKPLLTSNPETYGPVINIPCTGKIEGESTTQEVNKYCEGAVVKTRTFIEYIEVVVTGHFSVSHLRDVYGLKTDDLKEGVWALSDKAAPKAGAYTWAIMDMDETNKKLIAFPNMALTSGFTFSIENGQEEIAEVELTFKAMKDSKGNFYYEAIAADITEPTLVKDWAEKFTPDLVRVPQA